MALPEWLDLFLNEANASADAINETLECAAEQLDIVIAIIDSAALHTEVVIYLDAMSIARPRCSACDDAGCEFCPVVPRIVVPHCRNCGHSTAWPVLFCQHCPEGGHTDAASS